MEWIKNLMVDLDINRVDLVKEGADANAFIKYYKSKEGGTSMTFKEIIAKLKPEDKAIIEQEIAEQVQKAACGTGSEGKKEEDVKKKEGEEAPKKKSGEEESMEDVFKSLDPRVKAMFDSLSAKAEAAEVIAKSLVEKEIHAEAVAKAKEVAGIGADENKLVEIYKSLKDKDEKLCNEVFDIFKTAANIKAEGDEMFEEVAKGRSTDQATGNAWDRIMTEATEIAKAKNITEAAAISEVVKAKPELYKEYLKELKK